MNDPLAIGRVVAAGTVGVRYPEPAARVLRIPDPDPGSRIADPQPCTVLAP